MLRSRASRLRVYFVGWLIAPGASLLPGPRLQLATSKFAFLESFIHTFCIDSLPVEWFLGLNDDAIAKLMSYVEVEAGPHQREGEKWEAEHMAAFRDKGLAWPAELHEESPTIKALQQKGILFHTNGLSARPWRIGNQTLPTTFQEQRSFQLQTIASEQSGRQ